MIAETGKTLVGRTLVIRCQWRENGNGKRCTATRQVRPQDKHQVKYCVAHQKENRRKIRRAKLKRQHQERRTKSS